MYSKILVPLDGSPLSEKALEHAAELAHGTDAEIILLEAVQDSLAAVPEARYNVPVRQVYGCAIRGMKYLEDIAGRMRRGGCKVRCDVLEGDPRDAILSYARREKVDLIVMSTHGRAGLKRKVLGCLAEKLVFVTSAPVMLVKRGVPRVYQLAKVA